MGKSMIFLCSIISIFALWSMDNTEARSYYTGIPTLPPRRTSTKRPTCDCSNSPDAEVCASNGITYINMCKFECAKQRVSRLRIVKTGSCKTLSKEDYWNKQSSLSG